MFILLSASAFNSDQSEILLFGRGLSNIIVVVCKTFQFDQGQNFVGQ